MSRKQVLIIVALLVLAALLYAPSLLRDEEGSGTLERGGFALELAGTPTRIDIVRVERGDTIRLESEPGGWLVDGHRADSAKVDDLLETLEGLRATELVARNPANHGQLGVADSTGLRIEVHAGTGDPLAFHLGDRDIRAGGYYVRAPGEERVYRLEGPAGGYLNRDLEGWRERAIAAVDTATVREILLRRDGAEVVLGRGPEGWRVGDAAADSSTVQALLRLLPDLQATGFPSDSAAATVDFSDADAEIDVFAENGGDVTGRALVLSLRLSRRGEGEPWLVRPADGTEVYELSAYTVDRLVPPAESLRAPPPD